MLRVRVQAAGLVLAEACMGWRKPSKGHQAPFSWCHAQRISSPPPLTPLPILARLACSPGGTLGGPCPRLGR